MKTKFDFSKFAIYLFILFGLFPIPYINFLYPNYLKIIQTIVIFIVILLTILDRKISKNVLCILPFFFCLLFSNLLNGNNMITIIYYVFRIFSIVLFYEHCLKKNPKTFLKVNEIYFNSLIVLNIFSILNHPYGMYVNADGYTSNWLLGFKNSHIEYILISILVTGINSIREKNKFTLKNYLIFILGTISTLLIKNSTAMIGIFIIFIYYCFKKFFENNKFMNIMTYSVTYIILFILIVIIKAQNIFKFIIVNVLHKDLTFTGRMYIWEVTINKILNKPLVGYGNTPLVYTVYSNKSTLFGFKEIVVGAHNSLLDVLYKTGILGLVSYIFIMVKICKELWKNKKSKISNFISIILFAYFIMMLTEAYSFDYIFIFYAFVSNLKYLTFDSKEMR